MATKRKLVDLPAGMREESILGLHYAVQDMAPQVYAWWNRAEDFGELRFKARDDGSVLAVAKGYDSDGSPVVAFGTGYDVVSALKGLEGAVARGGWRPDRPWTSGDKREGGA